MLFNISLTENHVKKSKISRVYQKFNNELSIINNIKEGKLGHRELSYIVNTFNKNSNCVDDYLKFSEELTQKYGFNIFEGDIDSEKIYFIFITQLNHDYDKFIKENKESKIKIATNGNVTVSRLGYEREGFEVEPFPLTTVIRELEELSGTKTNKYEFDRLLDSYYK